MVDHRCLLYRHVLECVRGGGAHGAGGGVRYWPSVTSCRVCMPEGRQATKNCVEIISSTAVPAVRPTVTTRVSADRPPSPCWVSIGRLRARVRAGVLGREGECGENDPCRMRLQAATRLHCLTAGQLLIYNGQSGGLPRMSATGTTLVLAERHVQSGYHTAATLERRMDRHTVARAGTARLGGRACGQEHTGREAEVCAEDVG
jgi:hypothetical protein